MNDDYNAIMSRVCFWETRYFICRIMRIRWDMLHSIDISSDTMFEVRRATRVRSAYDEHIYEVLRQNDYE